MSDEHPYSLVREANGTIYVSGAASINYDRKQPVTGRREAVDAALREVERRLATVNATRDDLIRLTYYLTDVSLRDEANEQFREFFAADPQPARTVIGVSELPYGASVVIEAIAVRQ